MNTASWVQRIEDAAVPLLLHRTQYLMLRLHGLRQIPAASPPAYCPFAAPKQRTRGGHRGQWAQKISAALPPPQAVRKHAV